MSHCCNHKNEGIQSVVLNVKGMSCDHCVKSIKKAVGDLTGVKDVDVNLETGEVTIEFVSDKTSIDAIKPVIEDLGYDVE